MRDTIFLCVINYIGQKLDMNIETTPFFTMSYKRILRELLLSIENNRQIVQCVFDTIVKYWFKLCIHITR